MVENGTNPFSMECSRCFGCYAEKDSSGNRINMVTKRPGLFAVMRAPFFSSILAPLLAGTLLAVMAEGEFNLARFFAITIMGLGLHAATNVYNDIFDTLQGTDRINQHRNDFSGGTGLDRKSVV